MSSCSSSSLAARLLDAVARECHVMADDIARLGGLVSGGTADSADLQAFDFLSQQAQAHALLTTHAARMTDGASALTEVVALVGRIPLPAMRARLLEALGVAVPAPVPDDELLLWTDG